MYYTIQSLQSVLSLLITRSEGGWARQFSRQRPLCLSVSFDSQDAHGGRKELTPGSRLSSGPSPWGCNPRVCVHVRTKYTVNHPTICLAILRPHTLCLGHLLIASRNHMERLLFTPVKKRLHKEGFILTQQPMWWWQEWEVAAHTVSSQEGEGGGGNGWHSGFNPHPSLPTSANSIPKLPQTCSEMCLLGDSRPHQADTDLFV